MTPMEPADLKTRRIGRFQVQILNIDAEVQQPLPGIGSTDDRYFPWLAFAMKPRCLGIEKDQWA